MRFLWGGVLLCVFLLVLLFPQVSSRKAPHQPVKDGIALSYGKTITETGSAIDGNAWPLGKNSRPPQKLDSKLTREQLAQVLETAPLTLLAEVFFRRQDMRAEATIGPRYKKSEDEAVSLARSAYQDYALQAGEKRYWRGHGTLQTKNGRAEIDLKLNVTRTTADPLWGTKEDFCLSLNVRFPTLPPDNSGGAYACASQHIVQRNGKYTTAMQLGETSSTGYTFIELGLPQSARDITSVSALPQESTKWVDLPQEIQWEEISEAEYARSFDSK